MIFDIINYTTNFYLYIINRKYVKADIVWTAI